MSKSDTLVKKNNSTLVDPEQIQHSAITEILNQPGGLTTITDEKLATIQICRKSSGLHKPLKERTLRQPQP